jgi:hypothetical protein
MTSKPLEIFKSDNRIVLIKYTIEGISPLLMHKFSDETYNQSKRVAKNMTPREIADQYAYKLPDGELYIPGECIYASIREAGKYHIFEKKKITTGKSTVLPAGMIMIDEFCGLGTKDFEVDSRSAVNGAIGARIISHRPRLDKWKTSFTLQIVMDFFPMNLIDAMICDAGNRCGLLSYRPLNKGYFGRFMIVGKEEV